MADPVVAGTGAGLLAIHLLGSSPQVLLDDRPRASPRGRKVWALLAYLVMTESAPSREWLAELLFAEAADPLNALSWNLTQLRRLLGDEPTIAGEPVVLRLPPGTRVDVQALTEGSWRHATSLPNLGRELLEGMNFSGSPGFEVWLLATRRRLAGATESVLREAARARLAAGDSTRAVELASRLVTANPLDEDAQELLIRAYATGGDHASATSQRNACVALFQRELGVAPGVAVLEATKAQPARRSDRPVSGPVILAHLESGLGAIDAGAGDLAITLLRQAVGEAEQVADGLLRVRTLVALGSALVHSFRGRDGEGGGILHEAITVAEQIGEPGSAAQAHRELGYVELLRGRYDRAQRWLRQASALSGQEPEEHAWALAVQGVALTDVGRHADAVRAFEQALRWAPEQTPGQLQAWVWTFFGRLWLLRGELVPAATLLSRALATARSLRWTAFVPLPEALLADVDLQAGRIDQAAAAYEHAHAMALQLGDPWWEGYAARGLGLVAACRGDSTAALHWIHEARQQCVRLPDAYLWVEGYCLDALCQLGVEHGCPEVAQWVDDLEALAGRTGMRELMTRAYFHRSRLGDPAAGQAARVLAAEVDNPALALLDRAP